MTVINSILTHLGAVVFGYGDADPNTKNQLATTRHRCNTVSTPTRKERHDMNPSITALCNRIQAAAINCDDYHVFVNSWPHIGALAVYVGDKDTDYSDTEREVVHLIDMKVYLDSDDAEAELHWLVYGLSVLGVEVPE